MLTPLTSHPVRLVVLGFTGTVGMVTALLWLPAATAPGQQTPFRVALFTGTGATSGALAVVDTGTHWSAFGEIVVLAGMQLGGLGFMTSASLLGLLASRRLGLRLRLVTATETQAFGLGDVRRVVRGVAATTFGVEAVVAVVLSVRLWSAHDQTVGSAVYGGVFHSVSAFNNAGFSLYPDNLVGFADDPVVLVAVAVAAVLGGLGFPVLFELRHEIRTPRTWSLHTKVTLWGYGLLAVAGAMAIMALEWGNTATLGQHGALDRLVGAGFGSVTARTAGFNAIDYGQADAATLLVTDALMFVGGGSASTAGGIKVSTFVVLWLAIAAEARGGEAVEFSFRRVPDAAVRQAVGVALCGVALVAAGTLALTTIADSASFDQLLFEATSAFGSVGLSTGVTSQLPAAGQYVLVLLMFVGRVGPIALASALALRDRPRLYRLPAEGPIVG